MTFLPGLILLITGLFVGLFGGMLGIGGGIIMTPVQYAVFTGMGYSPEVAIKLALATSLAVILPTSLSSTWKHHQKKAVLWRAALTIGGVSLVFSFIGATLSSFLPGSLLKVLFGFIALAGAARMLFSHLPEEDEQPTRNPWLYAAWGVPIGLLSGIFGIGGGIMAVPIMTIALHFQMRQAVATSSAMIILTSIGGIFGYIVNGHATTGLPPGSIGYINAPAWLLLSASAVLMAQLGATAAHKLPGKQLSYAFIALITYMGLRMIGVFDWLNLPF